MSRHTHTDELFDFKRIFTLMLGLVVLPTLLLSGFGILAIKNERAALEKRLRNTYQERSKQVETALMAEISQMSRPPNAELANETLNRIARALFPDDQAIFALIPLTMAPEDRTIMETLRNLSPNWKSVMDGEDSEDAQKVQPIISRPLQSPLNEYQLAAYLPASDPVGDAMIRNTIIYSSLMVVFLALVIIGVVITARFIHRELRLSRLQTDFVSNISHELRTPLTSIRMFIETLQMGRARSEAEVQECLDIVATESERLTTMIERILGWARMEAGKRVYSFQPVPVSELIDEVLRAFLTQQLMAEISLHREEAPDLPPVYVDRAAMVEALLNLLYNAVKYTGEKKEITLKACLSRGLVALEVADNGVGISAQDRKRVFDKFYRADALLSRKTEGSGLGLTIVRHVVEAHGGKILVESELGIGSRFTLLLPPGILES